MQTTLRINDSTYRRAKAKSSELGLSLTRFFEEAVEERLAKLETPNNIRVVLPVSSVSGPRLTQKDYEDRLRTATDEADSKFAG